MKLWAECSTEEIKELINLMQKESYIMGPSKDTQEERDKIIKETIPCRKDIKKEE